MSSLLAVPEICRALSDPTRVAMLERLGRGSATVSELGDGVPMSLRGVLKHVQVLEDARLVHTKKIGRVRTCELVPARLDEVTGWMDELRSRWERRLDRMEKYLNESTQEEP